MPYKTDKLKLGSIHLDKRVRLLDCQKERLKAMREEYGYSYNKLAKIFHCSKRLAMFICDPAKESICKAQYKERRKDGRYYKKDLHTLSVKKHRKHKYNTLKNLNS